jgi:DNA-binding NtrC family response regulator
VTKVNLVNATAGGLMKRVLVVDDDPQVLSLMGRWLSAAGYDVVMADNFKDARVEIHVSAPDIAVIDVRLADFNGLQLGLLARESRPDMRLIFVSGWDDTVLRREATGINAAFIQKPLLSADDLLAVVDEEHTLTPPRRKRQTAASAAR